jgi:hypothetical protein
VCSKKNVVELFRENGLSADLCEVLPLAKLKPKHLIVISPKQLCALGPSADVNLIPKLSSCLGKIKNAHKRCLNV